MPPPLFDAVLRGDLERAAELLAGGADPDESTPGWPGWRPLQAAVEAIDAEGAPVALLELLIDHGADVNAWDRANDSTPLAMAVFRGLPECVHSLLARGADPNVATGEGDTPIRWAVLEDSPAMAMILLAHGVAPSIDEWGTGEGTTPLGAVARRGRLDMVNLLLDNGANPSVKDVDGFTAQERVEWELARSCDEVTTKRLERFLERLRGAAAAR